MMDWTDALDYAVLWRTVVVDVVHASDDERRKLYVVESHRLTGAYRFTTVTNNDGGAN